MQPAILNENSVAYRPVNIYDAPGLMLSRALDGDATWRGMGYTAFRPEMLTPSERMGLSDRLRESLGGGGIAGALADIATNPWVWLAAFTSSPALKLARAGGGDLFQMAKKLSPTLSDKAGLMRAAGLLGTDAMLASSGPLVTAGRDVADQTIKMVHEGIMPINNAVAGVLKANGLESLEMGGKWFTKRATPQQQELVKRINYLLHQKLDGWDKKRRIFRGFSKDGDTFTANWEKVEILAASNIDEQVGGIAGLEDLVKVSQKSLLDRKIKLFGKEGLAKFEVDEDKMRALWRGRGELRGMGVQAADSMANEFRTLVGDDVWQALKKDDITKAEFDKLVEQAAELDLPEAYLPRNTSEWAERAQGVGRNRYGRPDITPDRSTVRRVATLPFWKPEQLDELVQLTGGSEHLRTKVIPNAHKNYAAQAAEQIAQGGAANEGFRVMRIAPVQAMEKYLEDSARTWALFIAEPTEAAFRGQSRAIQQGLWPHPKVPGIRDEIGGAKLTEDWSKVAAEKKPLGGFKNFDFIRAHWAMLEDRYARSVVEKVVVPRLLGQVSDESFTMGVLAEHTNKMVNRLLEGPVGKAIEAAGPGAKRFVDQVKYATDPDFPVNASRLTRGVASYLYTTHMGFNLGTVLLNSVQPLGAAAVTLGVGPVLRAYTKAFKEVTGYVQERASQGFRTLTEVERGAMVKKHFRHADVAGIGPNLLDDVDSRLLARGEVSQKLGFMDKLTNYTLGLFQTSEMLNRSVTAHAFEEVWSKGLAKRASKTAAGAWDPEFSDQVKRFVANTQFTSDWWERPVAALSGDPEVVQGVGGRIARAMLANPLGAQFLNFPIRSFTFATHVAPRLGGEENPWLGFARTMVRGMGIGSVLYAVGKNMLDTDVSRGLYFASSTDILPFVGGGRFDARESPVPLSPIYDIPVATVKALASEDSDWMGTVLPRLLPGGIAMSRALKSSPSVQGVPVLGGLQPEYVDWTTVNEDGTVNVMDRNQNVVKRQSPSELILKGVGFTYGAGINPGEIDNYLLKQREQTVSYRREYANALLNNDVWKAQSLAAEYQTRFKVPLTITPQQLDRVRENRNVSRRERIVKTFSVGDRARYGPLVGVPAAQLPDATKREVERALSRMQQVGPSATAASFTPYEPY